MSIKHLTRKGRIALCTGAVVAVSASAVAIAQIPNGVPNANPRTQSPLNVVASPYVENPVGIFTRYGYLNDQPAADAKNGIYPESTKTEPDGNAYVKGISPGGPTPGYDYGSHFLYQSHENGKLNTGATGFQAYITRVNLDVKDPAHRITLQTPPDENGNTGFTRLDGSVYDPFNEQILGAQEGDASTTGGIVGSPVNWGASNTPPAAQTYLGSLGRGGYEGIRFDSKGNLIVLEDIGGSNVNDPDPSQSGKNARSPNSFVYRFVPKDGKSLDAGKLQVLQATVDGSPISYHGAGGCADSSGKTLVDDTFGSQILDLHSGTEFPVKWVTIHDTDTDGTTVFNANALAKTACGTPFKRPENGGFLPGTKFQHYVFDETGDTSAASGSDPNAAARGAWGSIFELSFPSTGSDTGTVKVVVNGDADHASFDTMALLDDHTILTGEDRGDALHAQLNKLDSLWSFDLNEPLNTITTNGKRLVALGRDPSATADTQHITPDSNTGSTSPSSYQNDGDNEVTGVIVSNGVATTRGLLGATAPQSGLHIFYTQQHGDNITYEIDQQQ